VELIIYRLDCSIIMSGSKTSPLPSSASASASPSPTPSQLDQLRAALNTTSGKQVLEHCLGLEQLKADLRLADSMVVVCLDTESWTHDQGKLTEIGIATFDCRDMRPGSHPRHVWGRVAQANLLLPCTHASRKTRISSTSSSAPAILIGSPTLYLRS
jgi:hypothetical protein